MTMTSIIAEFFYHYLEKQEKATAESAEETVKKQMKGEFVPSESPKLLNTRREDTDKGTIFYLNESTSSDRTVFYIHGGAYHADFSKFHWMMIDNIIKHTKAAVIAPGYRLVPYGTYRDAFDLIVPVYERYIEENPNKKIVLMGDSAGGGLSLALAEHLKMNGIRLPDELILLSPWVDIAMDNPELVASQDKDPWLRKSSLEVYARYWADGLDLHDWHVSPTYSDLKGLDNVTVFLGTEELIYPDVKKFFAKLDSDGKNELIIGEGLLHVYPLMPTPEGKLADKEIYQRINR